MSNYVIITHTDDDEPSYHPVNGFWIAGLLQLRHVSAVHEIKSPMDIVTVRCYDVRDLSFLPALANAQQVQICDSACDWPPNMSQLTRLTSLSVAEIGPERPRNGLVLQTLTNLQHLDLCATASYLTSHVGWEHLKQLTRVDLAAHPAFDFSPFTNVKELHVYCTELIRDATNLRRLTRLQRLSLYGTAPLFPLRLDVLQRLDHATQYLCCTGGGDKSRTRLARPQLLELSLSQYHAARTHVSQYLRGLHGLHLPPYVLAEVLAVLPDCRYFEWAELVEFAIRMQSLGKLQKNKRGLRPTRERIQKVLRGERVYT